MNNPSLKIFRGIHDVAVGIRKELLSIQLKASQKLQNLKYVTLDIGLFSYHL